MDTLFNSDVDYLGTYIIPWAVNLVLALVIFIIGRWIARAVTNAVGRLMKKGGIDESLVDFLSNLIFAALLVVVIIAALGQLGVDTTSVMAIFATAGLAVGLALKDSLGNLASGVMLVLFKPFKLGDFIEAGGVTGVVESIRIFSTLLKTADNREITVPNGQIYGGTIVNFSARDTRRIDLIFGIGYDDDIRQAKQLIEKVMAADERILKDPAAAVMVAELADSSVNLAVRPWVATADYWGVRAALLENIKITFDEAGISIPYPQTDVHLFAVDEQAA
ncbi:Small-conductance mechanosensitive channel [hydrothermal vent metagenome]|uniref:Small-conductance mechanosensitive channel n=1 Tax=hydrothermal vent metagenome TaxID=652676 RepID=A0A3B1BA51_9ZZZZ